MGTSLRGSSRFSAVTTMVVSASASFAGVASTARLSYDSTDPATPNAASTASLSVEFMFYSPSCSGIHPRTAMEQRRREDVHLLRMIEAVAYSIPPYVVIGPV